MDDPLDLDKFEPVRHLTTEIAIEIATFDGARVCPVCAALVGSDQCGAHADWHKRIGSLA